MKISVIIATYNRQNLLKSLIEWVRKQNIPSEIVVADDGSESPVVCGDKYLWRKDDGFHKAWMVNKASEMATGDILVFMDDDTRPRSRLWLHAHLKALQSGPVSRGSFYLGRLDNAGKFHQYSPYIFGLPGTSWSLTNTAMKREVWEDLGGFDERFDGSYGFEDVDLGIRIKESRIRVSKAVNTATAEHIGKRYCGEEAFADDPRMARNKAILEDKWGDSIENLVIRSG